MGAEKIQSPSTLVWRRVLILALALLLVAVNIQYALKTSEDRSAFVRWRSQVQALVNGEDIYNRCQYPNAPLMGLILYPLSLLPEVTISGLTIDLGAQTWFFLKVGMALLAFRWSFRLIQEAGHPFPPWAQALTVALSLRPIIGDLTHGNVNLLILFLVVASLYAFKHKRDAIAGLILALAITCKVTPALFLPYFLWKRAWTAVATCLVGLALFFFVVPGMILGPSQNWKLLGSWAETMVLPYTLKGEVVAEHNNQSLPALVYRLGTHSPSFVEYPEGRLKPTAYHNVISLEPIVARRIVQGCGLVFLVLLCWSCRTPRRLGDSWRLAAEYSIVLLGMLLFSERTWKHHCVTLLLPYATLCYYLAVVRTNSVWRYLVIGTIVASVALMATTNTSVWELLGYRMGAKLAQVYGAYAWAELALLACLAAILSKHRSEDRSSAASSSALTV